MTTNHHSDTTGESRLRLIRGGRSGRNLNEGIRIDSALEDPVQRREMVVVRAGELRRADGLPPAPDGLSTDAGKLTECAVRPPMLDAEAIELAPTRAGVCEGHDGAESHKMLSHLQSGALFVTMCQPFLRDRDEALLGLSGITGAGCGAVVSLAAARHSAMADRPNRIKEWRDARRMSAAELARRLNTTRQTVSRLEKGPRSKGGINLTTEWMLRIAAVLEVHPRDLIAAGQPVEPAEPDDLEAATAAVDRSTYRLLYAELEKMYREHQWPLPPEEIALIAFESWNAIRGLLDTSPDPEAEVRRELDSRRRVLRDVRRQAAAITTRQAG